MQNILIVGATSAIATATARLWVSRGANVFLVGRNATALAALQQDLAVRAGPTQKLGHFVMDARDSDRNDQMLSAARAALGSIDVVLVAHGTLPDQQVCEQSVAAMAEALEVNALSVMRLLTPIANEFEAQRRGVIAVIGSVAGDRGRQSNYVYGAAKGALALFLQGLRNRLSRHGVRVITIKPGFVDTPMTAAFDKKGPLWATPDQIAQGIAKAVEKVDGEVYLPWFWFWIMLIIKSIPERIFKGLKL